MSVAPVKPASVRVFEAAAQGLARLIADRKLTLADMRELAELLEELPGSVREAADHAADAAAGKK